MKKNNWSRNEIMNLIYILLVFGTLIILLIGLLVQQQVVIKNEFKEISAEFETIKANTSIFNSMTINCGEEGTLVFEEKEGFWIQYCT